MMKKKKSNTNNIFINIIDLIQIKNRLKKKTILQKGMNMFPQESKSAM